ncbi:zinc finger CCCH domain-containing protein 13-like isoform X3 [Mercenaria mercenaria]|nr:zinc finger CCCH domain-containing protein 13-like isoform X2 [Mercenaria mercenaria]XP_053377059.1 zinc finger CCCH domain-containing protein 13-like isoform X3 [Mercenaria mercenaria]
MHPELNEEPEDTNQSARPASPERLQVEPQAIEMSPSAGDKRPVSSPGDSSVPPFKRQRLTTSQPLPEEASQSQYEMISVVMTHSGILSPIREGKVPDSKAPPAGFKQIVIVRQKSAGQTAAPGIHLPSDASVIKLDFNKDPSKGGKIVQVEDMEKDAGAIDFDRNDPEYKPKAKKKFKDFKRDKLTAQKPFKIKRGPGRPRSPGRAAVVHNKGAVGFSRIPAVSGMNQIANAGQEGPMDLSLKPTPPPPNISVVKTEDQSKELEFMKYPDYKPKSTALSKQQEKDYEDTIDSVIGNKTSESDFDRPHHREAPVSKDKKSKQVDEWRVSHISESYAGDEDEEGERENRDFSRPSSESSFPLPPPTMIAPHLKLLYGASPAVSVSPRPRGRPRGSGSGFYRSYAGRSPMGGRRGRPPLHRGSPGRPPLNRSPGRPPLNRSPGRPPLNRSPGRPSSGRSPGRPKGSGMSPRPRGRPRGSKSPRNRGASPRGGSPRAITHLKFDETNDSNDSSKATHIFKLDNEDSEATLFEFPSRSPPPKSPKKEPSPVPASRTPPVEDRSSSVPSPAPTEPAESSGSREVSPELSPASVHSLPFKREPTPEEETHFPPIKDRSPLKDTVVKDKEVKLDKDREKDQVNREKFEKEKTWDREHSRDREHKEYSREEFNEYKREHKEQSRDKEKNREYSRDREREHKEPSRDREREHKEHSRDREREHKEHNRDKERAHKEHSRDKDREYKEHSRDRERENKEHSRDRDIIKDREHKEHSRDRDYKEHSKDRDSRDRDHKEHSRDRDSRDRDHKEHSRDRERERSKEHRKDKKKKKKKNKDREKEKEDDKEKKEKHKEKKEREREKEPREESPSIPPLQKLKIKFGGGSASSPGSFSISTSKLVASPKPEPVSPVHRPEIPKLKFKMLPPKPDASAEGDQSWVSSIKKEKSATPKHESLISSSPRVSPSPGSRTASPKPKYGNTSDSDNNSEDEELVDKTNKSGEEEVTVSVVKGKVIVKKPAKRGKRKGSVKKGRPKGDGSKKEESSLLFGDANEGPVAAIKREPEKEASPISPPFSPQNVPSPITIPALKAAPPPPSPPAPSKKISPPKPKPLLKEQKPLSPLVKDTIKPKPVPVPVAKVAKVIKSPRRLSPKKSPKISPTSKKKGSMSPPKTSPTKTFPFMEFTSPRTPSPRRSSSPSASAPSSPMYSPASSPARDSPLHFQIPPTPAFPTRTHSPPPSPVSRQISTDEEVEGTSADKPRMLPPELPPMPPTSAQKRAQRTVITETIGTFVNESGEKIWICPACTMQDDGSAMIGCDICDEWYHWVCVGIEEEPSEDSSWYCPKCVKPSKSKSKRGRKKRKS